MGNTLFNQSHPFGSLFKLFVLINSVTESLMKFQGSNNLLFKSVSCNSPNYTKSLQDTFNIYIFNNRTLEHLMDFSQSKPCFPAFIMLDVNLGKNVNVCLEMLFMPSCRPLQQVNLDVPHVYIWDVQHIWTSFWEGGKCPHEDLQHWLVEDCVGGNQAEQKVGSHAGIQIIWWLWCLLLLFWLCWVPSTTPPPSPTSLPWKGHGSQRPTQGTRGWMKRNKWETRKT